MGTVIGGNVGTVCGGRTVGIVIGIFEVVIRCVVTVGTAVVSVIAEDVDPIVIPPGGAVGIVIAGELVEGKTIPVSFILGEVLGEIVV